ncbi:MAG: hypothetical protein AB1500_10860 [Bacillota bacterium]
MGMMNSSTPKEFDFNNDTEAGLIICAGGFEHRSLAFPRRIRKSRCSFESALILHYESQREDNQPNYIRLGDRLAELVGGTPEIVPVNANTPIQSIAAVKSKISDIYPKLSNRSALIDISGMTHLWAIGAIHYCLTHGFRISVVYTEARWYFPLKRDKKRLVKAWITYDYDTAADYLQSAALKSVHIPPEFGGNFRPDRQTCLMVFAGYEPNRIEGLVELYAPGALIVFYGKSPHEDLQWRTDLSRQLHSKLFSRWHLRETEISTLVTDEILAKLEEEFRIVKEHFDVAITPHCSKMQGLAAYLFWRRHPEVQLLFTSPVRFNPERYSRGSGKTYVYEINI